MNRMSKPPQAEGGGGRESTTRFLRLADRPIRPAYRLAGYLLGSSDEAEDAVQEAILRAWRAWPNSTVCPVQLQATPRPCPAGPPSLWPTLWSRPRPPPSTSSTRG